MKNQFQAKAFAKSREMALGIQLSQRPHDSGSGIEFTNHLNRTVFTVYDKKLDAENKNGIEIAFGVDNISEEYKIDPVRISKWLDDCLTTFAHPAKRKTSWQWQRLAFHKESDFQSFSEEFVNFLNTESNSFCEDVILNDNDSDSKTDERILSAIWSRRGQSTFRKELLHAYDNVCAITGCSEIEVLEAAHITPYKVEQTYNLANGLILRADIHTLFDLSLISINPQSGEIVVSKKLSTDYQLLHGKLANLPSDTTKLPDYAALMKHCKTIN
ncbi:HNH endonuclease [Shewanella olleyana]|uniref:HNH endonuclease n=1 Tax=Shewanella olleyana TaxID=135626 RepID=UPI00200F9FE8|nr:HNH endonuclease [Shewanella olleyana]MCL1068899.1 HNH endonuclease [Shewanella olleyana]